MYLCYHPYTSNTHNYMADTVIFTFTLLSGKITILFNPGSWDRTLAYSRGIDFDSVKTNTPADTW
jgi:hypothetical protein